MFRTLALSALAVSTAAVAAAPMPAKTYVMKAGAGDLFEIESSQLVMDSSNAKVAGFAKKMISDHTRSTADVKAAAVQAGMTPTPARLDAKQAAMISALRHTPAGPARDKLYLADQKTSHQQALMLHQSYAADGTVPSLKMAAGKIAPVVQNHIDLLQSM